MSILILGILVLGGVAGWQLHGSRRDALKIRQLAEQAALRDAEQDSSGPDARSGVVCPSCGSRSTGLWCECGQGLHELVGVPKAAAPLPDLAPASRERPRRGTKPVGQEKWTWQEIEAGRRISKSEKRTRRMVESLGASPNGTGGYTHTPESMAAGIAILVVVLVVAIFFPNGC